MSLLRFVLILSLISLGAESVAGQARNPNSKLQPHRPNIVFILADNLAAHAAMITRLDADVGRLMALLKELQIDDDTLVMFSSDNGPHAEGGNDPVQIELIVEILEAAGGGR